MRSIAALAIAIGTLGCEPGATWDRVHEDLDEGLMTVWGRSANEVYVGGSDAGRGPLVMRYDGSVWRRLDTGTRGDVWWIHGGASGPIFMGGSDGLVLRYEDGAFTRMDTPGIGTVFGIWSASPTDAWAVGGIGGTAGFAWRYDGTSWSEVAVPGLGDRALFKVWGLAADDVWFCGAGGALYRWDGSAMSAVDAGTTRTLFTVHVDGARGVAVGGAGNAALVERDGAAWADRSPMFVPQLFGVWLTGSDGGYAVGGSGVVLRRTPEGWIDEEASIGFIPALHAVWVDDAGGVWAVGGQVISSPLSSGVVIHYGSPVSGTIEEGT